MGSIRTRILVLANPKECFNEKHVPLVQVDVVIHCGSLADPPTLANYEAAIRLLHRLEASLKLYIPSCGDRPLDPKAYLDEEGGLAPAAHGLSSDVGTTLRSQPENTIRLTEGTHSFRLGNGALLKVYASPFIPGVRPAAFTYKDKHAFDIEDGTHVVITHGPARFSMFGKSSNTQLAAAVERVKPLVHCHGHDESSWGAWKLQWRKQRWERVLTAKDVFGGEDDSADIKAQRTRKLQAWTRRGFCEASLSKGGEEKTRFVNATMRDKGAWRWPWLVQVDLPREVITIE